jgi:thioredoxin 1
MKPPHRGEREPEAEDASKRAFIRNHFAEGFMSDKPNIVHFTEAGFDNEVLKSTVPVLVDFWAEWCAPCRMLAPTVEAIANQYQGKIKVGKVNVDENQNVSFRYNVRGIPTLILFKNGEPKDQIVGNTGRDNIAKMIDRHLA